MNIASPVPRLRAAMSERARPEQWLLPLLAGAAAYAVLLAMGYRLLVDPDTHWQVVIGQWIVDNRTVPVADIYSFTMRGEPWRSSQWLALVLYSQAYALCGWGGIVALAALAIAAAFALLAHFLLRRLSLVTAMVLLTVAFAVAWSHFFARPHVLALPVMAAWAGALLSAAERRAAPSFLLVALMTLWANLHGSYVLGLALIGPTALEAVWNAAASDRRRLVLRWAMFGAAALAASCITPYGFKTFAASYAILNLGDALALIREWKPASFGTPGALEVVALLAFALALVRGMKLPLIRTALFVGLLYMALAHVRHAHVFALLAPMIMATPLAAQFARLAAGSGEKIARWRVIMAATATLLIAITAGAVWKGPYRPAAAITPQAAVAVLKEQRSARVFNDYDFGGYLISQGMAPFIDGRAELYGEKFVVQFSRARDLSYPAVLFDILDRYRIDATLLRRSAPAAQLLDHLEGWRKIFIDDYVVIHVRDAAAGGAVDPEEKPASN